MTRAQAITAIKQLGSRGWREQELLRWKDGSYSISAVGDMGFRQRWDTLEEIDATDVQ